MAVQIIKPIPPKGGSGTAPSLARRVLPDDVHMAYVVPSRKPKTDPFSSPPNISHVPVHRTYLVSKPKTDSLILVGYLCAFGSLLVLPPALGLTGIICGCINLTRGRTGHGIMQIILSATCGLFGMMLGYMSMGGR